MLLWGLGCGTLFVTTVAAQVDAAKVPPSPPALPAGVSIVGEVEVSRVALAGAKTVVDVVHEAKPKITAALDWVVLVRRLPSGPFETLVDARPAPDAPKESAGPRGRRRPAVRPERARTRRREDPLPLADAIVGDGRALTPAVRAHVVAWRLVTASEPARWRELVRELGRAGADAEAAVPLLVAALHGDTACARDAASALGTLGVVARSALAPLARAATIDDSAPRECCKNAIAAIEAAIAAAKAAPTPRAVPRR